MTTNGHEPVDHVPYSQSRPDHFGLTKREWFAGMAMQGLASRDDRHDLRNIAVDAVTLADNTLKMLEEF